MESLTWTYTVTKNGEVVKTGTFSTIRDHRFIQCAMTDQFYAPTWRLAGYKKDTAGQGEFFRSQELHERSHREAN